MNNNLKIGIIGGGIQGISNALFLQKKGFDVTIFVISQPDLGTSILIALSGLIILWLGGVKIKYFIYSFITFLISLPFIISFLKPYQKLRILTFLDPDSD